MKVLVIGAGAREHALCWKLAQEAEVFCAPGNPGIAGVATCVPIVQTEIGKLIEFARTSEIDLVVVGPENPLIAGMADAFREQGFPCFGPGKAGAMLEASKSYSKALMRRAGVPTAEYQSFFDATACKEYCRKSFAEGKPVVVKASGNAMGKGVIVGDDYEATAAGIDELVAMGEASRTMLVETRLNGREFSLLTMVSDEGFKSLPIAQDFKRIFDGDKGPNTGGMGSYSPVGWVTDDMVAEAEAQAVMPILNSLKEDGIQYRGVLFSGMMGSHVLEYNVRFGDPEIQSVVMRLGNGFAKAL
ncbi:MAG TPA: phosphoribosylamine--glycine ligase, partial [Fimbriimonas sp.]|nr:phosphoribosylamine--glycine ligase [Fimbriimonas sp.]